MSSSAPESPRRHRLTVEDYYRMGETGILRADQRVELIDGEIIDMPPIGPRHAGTVKQLTHLLQRVVADRALVQCQNPIRLDRRSEPQPDIALLRPRPDFYKSSHPEPAEVLLIVEVAETSLHFDRNVKAGLYAGRGIPEYWLVDVNGKTLTRYRHAEDGAYVRVDEPDLGTPLEIGGLPGVRVALGAVFD